MEKSVIAMLNSCKDDILDEIIEKLQSNCKVSDDIVKTIKQSVFPVPSNNTSGETSNLSSTVTVGYGNQGHGKIIEKNIAMLKYGVNITKYSHISKYDIESVDNHLTNKNISIKTTKNNLVCCGDVFRFLQSENCEMIVVRYNQHNDTKQIGAMYSLHIDDLVAHYENDNMTELLEYRTFIHEQKKYFRENGNTDAFKEFREYCKHKSKQLSTSLIRINTKISTPKETSADKFKCDNFRIQCSINIDTLKSHQIEISDISHELHLYEIPLTISSMPRQLKS